MIEYIKNGDEILSIIVRSKFSKEGIHFFTENNLSQQLAFMKHSKGKVIEPHVHNPVPREVHYTQEVLFIRSGRLRVDFYNEVQTYLESRVLYKGDTILLATGGHGFEVLDDVEMLEVKQGPYAGEKDKTRFKGISAQEVILRNEHAK